ncbi:hypothetical protein [Sphingobium sp. R-7]|uniref:hypothetical protein n=1 Tax=Sphingobium sp. R-7 TaxID=3375449 RepID=UPI00398AD44C
MEDLSDRASSMLAGSPDELQEMTIDPPIGGFPLIGWWVPKALEGKNGFPADG